MAGPPDVYNIDVKNVQAASEAVRDFSMSAEKSAEQMRQVRDAMNMVAEARSKMMTGEFTIIDPTSKEAIEGLAQDLIKAGVPMAAIVKLQKQFSDYTGKIVINEDNLTKSEKKFCDLQKKKIDNEKTYANVNGQLIKLGDRQVLNQSKTIKAFKEYGTHAKRLVSSMASVDLSIMGIIALLIEARNLSTKIAGLSSQAASHWGSGDKALQSANKNIWTIWGRFRKTVDESGAFVKSLESSGLNLDSLNDKTREVTKSTKDQKASYETIYGLSSLIMANEIKFGLAASEQTKIIKGLVNNFNLGEEAAAGMLGTVRDSAIELKKTGTAISMEEVISDWTELADKTKMYNTDLLGTLSLYNSLMSKDVAKTLGLGNVPMSVRRQISKTFAGMSNELSMGWKAALGTGATAAARILNFEKLVPEEQFRKVAEFISKHMGSNLENGILRGRLMLEQLGFGKEEQKALADAVSAGGLRGGGIDKAVAAIKAEREKAQGLAEKEKANRQSLVDSASSIAVNLQSVQDYLKQWIDMHIVGVLNDLIGAIHELIDTLEHPGEAAQRKAKGIVTGQVSGALGEVIPQGLMEKLAGTAKGKETMGRLIRGMTSDYAKELQGTNMAPEVRQALVTQRGQQMRENPVATGAAMMMQATTFDRPGIEAAISKWNAGNRNEAINSLIDVLDKLDRAQRLAPKTPRPPSAMREPNKKAQGTRQIPVRTGG